VRKLKDMGGTLMDKEIPELNPVETSLRPINEQLAALDHEVDGVE